MYPLVLLAVTVFFQAASDCNVGQHFFLAGSFTYLKMDSNVQKSTTLNAFKCHIFSMKFWKNKNKNKSFRSFSFRCEPDESNMIFSETFRPLIGAPIYIGESIRHHIKNSKATIVQRCLIQSDWDKKNLSILLPQPVVIRSSTYGIIQNKLS